MRKEEKLLLKDIIGEAKTSPDLSKIQKFLLTFKSIVELIIWIIDKMQERKR